MAKTCRILVVDAYKDAADSLQLLLKVWGYQARVAYTPDDALEVAESFVPDVVLLEIVLPYKDGYRLGRELMDKHPHCKVAAVTTAGTEEHFAFSRQNGFLYHLLKPVEPEKLNRIIRALHRSLLRECG